MSDVKTQEMKRLYFRKSKNSKGQDCFIAKVKEYVQEEGKKKQFAGDVIVIANSDRCKIHKTGRWDVEVKEMYGAKGYLVTEAEWTIDLLDFAIDWDNHSVYLLVNGEETKLKRESKDKATAKFLPLSFRSADFYPFEKIAEHIKEKSIYLQLSPAFNLDLFLQEFQRACEAIYKDYQGSRPQYSTPNTPMAEALGKLK